MHSMPNREQEQDPEGEASGGESAPDAVELGVYEALRLRRPTLSVDHPCGGRGRR